MSEVVTIGEATLDRCYIGDVRDGLREFIAQGVRAQVCVTSPPYWGLRDYGVTGQIGLERTIAEYVANMVDVFRQVREVLADDGTLWLNLGDSYAGGKTGRDDLREFAHSGGIGNSKRPQDAQKHALTTASQRAVPDGLKPKDLCGIPWAVAFALRDDGWYLRSDCIWAKPNPMPESVTDRPTKSHEYLFLLSKRASYYYDAAAIRETATYGRREWSDTGAVLKRVRNTTVRGVVSTCESGSVTGGDPDAGRNKRTVWTIASEPYADAHFATFPTALVEPCILAGSRVGDVVLDPFLGSGTVAQVAQALGRRWIGCELNESYVAMQARRTAQAGIAFA